VPPDEAGGDVFVRVSLQAALKTLLFIACRLAGGTCAPTRVASRAGRPVVPIRSCDAAGPIWSGVRRL